MSTLTPAQHHPQADDDHGHGHADGHRHAGDHDHSGEHGHPPVGEAAPGPSKGAVVLDIGGDVGAAVIRTPASMDELEIEIRRAGTEWDATHVAVRERIQPGRPQVFAAVFPSLVAGSYDLRVRFGAPGAVVHRIDVVGGEVALSNWPEPR